MVRLPRTAYTVFPHCLFRLGAVCIAIQTAWLCAITTAYERRNYPGERIHLPGVTESVHELALRDQAH